MKLNGFNPKHHETRDADVNALLRELLKTDERFDAIVLDPPKFAPTAAHADKASRAYKDINRLALKLLKPGGLLLTFSCSGGISADLFHKIVAGAAMDRRGGRRAARAAGRRAGSPDDAVLSRGGIPEGVGDPEGLRTSRRDTRRGPTRP